MFSGSRFKIILWNILCLISDSTETIKLLAQSISRQLLNVILRAHTPRVSQRGVSESY